MHVDEKTRKFETSKYKNMALKLYYAQWIYE